MALEKIRCCAITYRQGFIEVLPNIHRGHVNLEVWNVGDELDLASVSYGDAALDDAYTRNVELELSVEEACDVVRRLQGAIAEAKRLNV